MMVEKRPVGGGVDQAWLWAAIHGGADSTLGIPRAKVQPAPSCARLAGPDLSLRGGQCPAPAGQWMLRREGTWLTS